MGDPTEKELIQWRAQRKMELKNEFLKQNWDPYRFMRKEVIFDSAIQRYSSMRACQYEYFKPTKKSARSLFLVFVPFSIFFYLVYKDRTQLEQKCSTGQVAYKDRRHKFLC